MTGLYETLVEPWTSELYLAAFYMNAFSLKQQFFFSKMLLKIVFNDLLILKMLPSWFGVNSKIVIFLETLISQL